MNTFTSLNFKKQKKIIDFLDKEIQFLDFVLSENKNNIDNISSCDVDFLSIHEDSFKNLILN